MDDKELIEALRRIIYKPKTTLPEVRREAGKILPKRPTEVIKTGPGDETLRIARKHAPKRSDD